MKQNQKIEQRIDSLKSKISDLKKVLASDTAASYKEAVQTTEMIEVYERQVCNLREEIANVHSGMKKYSLVTEDEQKDLFLVEFGADPFKGWITKKSPLGIILMDSKVGDIVKIGTKDFKLAAITDA